MNGKRIITLSFILLFMLAGTGYLHGKIPQKEREALIALYNSTNGDNWTNNSGWKKNGDFSPPGTEKDWYGVSCDGENKKVWEIFLDGNNLVGTIPAKLGNLSNLSFLYLDFNHLTGSIPPELGNLSKLEVLFLIDNHLTGGIPPELGQLSNLTWLAIESNQLTGSIPPELANLSNLVQISLSSNQLTGNIPPVLSNLSNLGVLCLDSNQLTGSIPPELAQLTNLWLLCLDSNQLTGSIPPELANLSSIETLSLSSNQLTGNIPPVLGNLSSLWVLCLSSNQLTGTIPPELGNLPNLETLDLSFNQLTGSIPPELGNLLQLETLDLSLNQLTGSIPPELGNLLNLMRLFLNFNQLDSIPSELANLASLETLDLSSNQLASIPPELGLLPMLNELYLSSNQLSVIPAELINLKNLSILYLNSNRLQMDVFFSNITSLTNLRTSKSDFRWNALSIDDESVRTFLNSKQKGGQWEHTQTVAPKDVSARPTSPSSVEVSWTPIDYSSDTGGYMVYYSQTPGAPYDDWHLFDTTGRKTDDRLQVTGLESLTPYYFVVKTRTESHPNNPNTLDSDYSAEVSSDTPGNDIIISGRVTTETGQGFEGVTLIFTSLPSEENQVEITDADGNYSHTVNYGWEGKVEPSKLGYSFDPPGYEFEPVTSNQTGKDFTAKKFAYSISGKVTSAGDGVEGVTLTFSSSSGETRTEITNSDGLYCHEVPFGWTGKVEPSNNSLLFSPPERDYNTPGIVGTMDNQDYQLSISMLLDVSRKRDSTLILRKEYGQIELNVEIIGPLPSTIDRFVISRKESGGTYQPIKEFAPTQGNTFTFEDKYLDKDKTYTYIARALDAEGKVIGESKEKTI